MSFRPGDWNCPKCNDHNFGSRMHCRQCGTEKPAGGANDSAGGESSYGSRSYGRGGYGGGGGGWNSFRKAGDWDCPKCQDLNFASRSECRKCGAQKPARGYGGERPGDWHCPNCSDMNFASRSECRKCGTAKPDGESGSSSSSGGGGGRSYSEQAMRPGDWFCPDCKDMNFASRSECRKCGAARP